MRWTPDRESFRIPWATPDPTAIRGSTSGWWKGAGRSSSSNSSITTRRSWIPPSNGSRTAWSSMTTATASPTGDTGSTTCPSTRRVSGPTGRGVPTSTPVERSGCRTAIRSGYAQHLLLRHLLPARGVRAGGRADLLWRRSCRWRHGPRAGRPVLHLGIGDRRWPRRGHGLCPRCRVAGSNSQVRSK